jgi:hypothetical protein
MRRALALVLATPAALAAAELRAETPRLRVEGTELVLAGADGVERRSADLVGAEIELPGGLHKRVDEVRRETAPDGAEVFLHRLVARAPDGQWRSACTPGPDGTELALMLPGGFADDGRFVPDPRLLSLSCTSGARAKCVRFGYAPTGAGDPDARRERYDACIRMVRADYCGDGRAHTVDGTTIDVYDHDGIQRSEGGADFRFEAGWTAAGAVCVGHTRIAAQGDVDALLAECPRLREAANGPACTEQAATRAGAVLFNRSR